MGEQEKYYQQTSGEDEEYLRDGIYSTEEPNDTTGTDGKRRSKGSALRYFNRASNKPNWIRSYLLCENFENVAGNGWKRICNKKWSIDFIKLLYQ